MYRCFLSLLLLTSLPAFAATGTVTGELRKWHRIDVTFSGPQTSETASPNPFRDYRLDVTFVHRATGARRVVPGYYAADGNAAQTGATSGNKWRVHFAPDKEGTWDYKASFRAGKDVAAGVGTGTATSFNGASGAFTVGPTNKTGRDFRGKGLLRHTGGHHLRFAQTGEPFLKGGADSPENFFAYFEFDNTQDNGGTANSLVDGLHRYEPHVQDWRTGNPTWGSGKGKGIIGALNYLADKGMNSVYALTMNVNGDGREVYPWTAYGERYRFDCSKLGQWEIVLAHMDALGLMQHLVTQETENDQLLDGGALGVQRKLYYRELIARFGHHLGVVWNLGEENTNTDAQRKQFADFFKSLDPYDHPVVVHTYPTQYDAVYNPLLGYPTVEGPSLQMGSLGPVHSETVKWIDRSAAAGRKWFVSLDEIGPAGTGVKPDADDFWHDAVRKQALWGNLMAGGAGVEWYFGYSYPDADLNCEDWRSRDHMWDLTRLALDFFRTHLPFTEMVHADGLTSASADYVLAKAGQVYAIYLPNGGTANLSLAGVSGSFDVRWFDPRNGGDLRIGSIATVSGGATVTIGNPPGGATTQDWVALVRKR
ncbi:MAG TPA: DUF5060 domain-containing protein [Thermoanaerobaculia bacterium]|nr:DUF5060 domain-containing protein [Thermoanaerobaculia bacterium]